MVYLNNAFSLAMLRRDGPAFTHSPITLRGARAMAKRGFLSVVGHANTAETFSRILGVEVETNRVSVTLEAEDVLLVGQYKDPRLPEGAKALPEEATIEWWIVEAI